MDTRSWFATSLAALVLWWGAAAAAGAAPAPLARRLDRLVAAALVELDRPRGESGARAGVLLLTASGPAVAAAGEGTLGAARLRHLLERMAVLLEQAAARAVGDQPTRRLVQEARRALARARRDPDGGPADAALVREALLRVDAASAALWSLAPIRPP